ncbi:MAG TPA: hypothetical protein D7I10_01530 [Candidatus Poseidoniales archaeon]|nr:MAG TPA: hypothetical protein D7I10_01530 [Candidatus Poseidoniales archaeon]HIH81101.1 hypothetical protein [Candidatus Thalassarchaeaceae archaeon]
MVSKSPNKQRKSAANAPLHVQRKRLRARCLDPAYANVRNVTIRVGDTVEVRRGDFGHPNSAKGEKGKRSGDARGKAGLRAAVASVDSSSGHIFIEGLTHSKADGKEEGIPVHSSNVVVVKIDDSDPIRLKKLQSMNGGDDE